MGSATLPERGQTLQCILHIHNVKGRYPGGSIYHGRTNGIKIDVGDQLLVNNVTPFDENENDSLDENESGCYLNLTLKKNNAHMNNNPPELPECQQINFPKVVFIDPQGRDYFNQV